MPSFFLKSLYELYIIIDPRIRYWKYITLNIKHEREREREMLHVHALFVRTQFTFRQRRLSLGRCEHKLDAPCPLHADHLLPTCNYGRFHRTLKSVARSWQSVCRSRVACRSRLVIAQILYPDVGDLSKTLLRLWWKFILKISIWLIDIAIKRRMWNIYSGYVKSWDLFATIYIYIFARIWILVLLDFSIIFR